MATRLTANTVAEEQARWVCVSKDEGGDGRDGSAAATLVLCPLSVIPGPDPGSMLPTTAPGSRLCAALRPG